MTLRGMHHKNEILEVAVSVRVAAVGFKKNNEKHTRS